MRKIKKISSTPRQLISVVDIENYFYSRIHSAVITNPNIIIEDKFEKSMYNIEIDLLYCNAVFQSTLDFLTQKINIKVPHVTTHQTDGTLVINGYVKYPDKRKDAIKKYLKSIMYDLANFDTFTIHKTSIANKYDISLYSLEHVYFRKSGIEDIGSKFEDQFTIRSHENRVIFSGIINIPRKCTGV